MAKRSISAKRRPPPTHALTAGWTDTELTEAANAPDPEPVHQLPVLNRAALRVVQRRRPKMRCAPRMCSGCCQVH